MCKFNVQVQIKKKSLYYLKSKRLFRAKFIQDLNDSFEQNLFKI